MICISTKQMIQICIQTQHMCKISIPCNLYDTTKTNKKEGESAEIRFRDLCYSKGWSYMGSSRSQNMHDHIDCFVTTPTSRSSVDVKAPKRICRTRRDGTWNQVQDEYHWCEWTAVNGRHGWVRSDVEWIAFGMTDGSFLMVYTSDLYHYVHGLILQWYKKRLPKAKCPSAAVNGTLWSRPGRKDEVTLIHRSSLLAFPNTRTLRF